MSHEMQDLEQAIAAIPDGEVRQVIQLASALCAEPGVSVPPARTDFAALARSVEQVCRFAQAQGLHALVRAPDAEQPYPCVVVGFDEHLRAGAPPASLVALIGHLDVVGAKDPTLWQARIEGDELRARGAADMKTVVASFLLWLARWQQRPGRRPPVVLLLSTCEENGSARPHHVRSTLQWLRDTRGIAVRFGVVGERTGELEWMRPAPRVGPICKENRAWRWLRVDATGLRGLAALQQLASALRQLREQVQALNDHHVPAAKAAAQPGLVSGLVNAFCLVQGEREPRHAQDLDLLVERAAGAAVHSATASAGGPSLLERFARLVEQLQAAHPGGSTLVDGVRIGEDGNFNTYDGSGRMALRVRGIPAAQLQAWLAQAALGDLAVRLDASAITPVEDASCLGLDLRELFDHRDAVERALQALQQQLHPHARVHALLECPAWRCPAEQPDLQDLEAAYAEVVGAPSPNLIKLHGNDGGQLAALQQASDADARARGLGHAVVFGQVGRGPHGPDERHLISSVRPYLDILDGWARRLIARADA